MLFPATMLRRLGKMICGDEPYTGIFPYRSSGALTRFFEDLDLDFVHDGSTRRVWVAGVLNELNQRGIDSDPLPARDLTRVIEHLVDPRHFAGDFAATRESAIRNLNEILQKSDLILDSSAHDPVLTTRDGTYASTAVPPREARRTITFSPSVFSIPDVEPDPLLVAIMMPFAKEFDGVHDSIVRAAADAGFHCLRADDVWDDATIIQDVFSLIYRSHAVVVDFSGKNPNVMYETGIAHTLGKHVVPIAQHLDDVPFDMRHHRVLKYLANSEGLAKLVSDLGAKLQRLK